MRIFNTNKMKGNIYIIKNDLNDKVYIGQTLKNVEDRFKRHCQTKTKDHFHMAMNKYGKEHFFVDLLESCDISILNQREIYWIAKYDSFKNGYNSTIGGEGKRCLEIYSDSNIQQQIIDLYTEQMYSSKKIAEIFNIDKSTVISFLKTVGVKIRHQQNFDLNEEEYNELLEKYQNGYSLRMLGKEYGVDTSTIKRCLIKHNADLRVKYNILNDEAAIKQMIYEWTNSSIHFKDLQKKYHVSYSVFKKILADNRIDFKKRHFKLSDKECLTIISMFNKGVKITRIASQFEVDKTTIYSILKRYNVSY